MRIVHLVNSLDTGGAETFVAQLVPALAARGLDASLAVLRPADGPADTLLRERGCDPGEPLGAMHRFDPRAIRAIRRHTRGADLVHTHLFPTQYFAALAWLAETRRPLLVTTEHNTANRRRRRAITRAIDRAIYRRYDAVVSVSEAVADGIGPLLDASVTRHERLPTAVDRDRFRRSEPDAGLATDSERRPAHPYAFRPRVAMIASFSSQKDHDTLLRAMTQLPDDVELILAGDGPRLGAVRALAYALGLAPRVRFVGRVDDVPGLLDRADVAVLATHHEGMPMVALEAFAAGVPFVGSAVPGLADLAERGGLAVAPRDADALAVAIARLLESPSARDDAIRRGRQLADEHAIDTVAARHHALYTELSEGLSRTSDESSSSVA